MTMAPEQESRHAASSRREAVLTAAREAMAAARTARQRRRGGLAGATMLALLAAAIWFAPTEGVVPVRHPLDSAALARAATPIDFQFVRHAPAVPLHQISDEELAIALRDAGECATLVREQVAHAGGGTTSPTERVWVLECDTGRALVEPFWASPTPSPTPTPSRTPSPTPSPSR